jgi:hypothetical protein
MKLCPQCKRTYSDDSLRFCLDDGAVLDSDSNVTLPYRPRQVEASQETILRPAPVMPAPSPPVSPVKVIPPASSSSPILTAGVIVIALLLLVLAVIGVAFVYKYWTASGNTPLPANLPTPAPTRESSVADTSKPASSGTLQIKTSASSVRYAVQTNTYLPANAVDNNKKTAWIEGVDGPGVGEWLQFDFGRELNLHRIVILPGYFKSSQIWAQNNRLAAATLQFSDGSSRHFTFPDRMERQSLDVGAIKTRWVRLVIDDVYTGTDPDTAVSEVTFEWEP